MFIRFRNFKRLSDLQRSTRPLADWRKHFPIGIIDDAEFPEAHTLARHGFDIKELGDITHTRDVEPYPIVACDIKNVGAHFGSPFEGAHLISEIRKTYPDKYVIAYSAGAYGADYKKLLDKSDVFLRRGAPVEDWVDSLDTAIQVIGDPINRWKRIRTLMFDHDVPVLEVALLEDAYIRSIQAHDDFDLKKALKRIRQQHLAGNIIENVATNLVAFVKLYASVAT
jgi:hypothetical protein